MKRNGFTLIELLAVIVLLAIIALIATPIILGIINDSREESNERSVELYASTVRNAVAAYQLTHPNAQKTFDDLDVQYDGNVECATEELYFDGSFYIADCTVNGDAVDYTYGEQQGSEVTKICSIEKQDATKYSIGDVVTCNIGNEPDKFYVVEDAELSATSIQMLTEKNIHKTEYRQSDDAGFVAFSSTNYWSGEETYIYDERNDIVKSIVDEYVSYLNTKLTGATGSLLTSSHIENFECLGGEGAFCSSTPSWVYSTDYWTGFIFGGNTVGYVYSNSGIINGTYDGGYYADDDYCGVRPVITISTSEIQ